jgi:undecaprenyl-diphosphatase
MSLLFALFLGLIQGITEFLPVSSSGHLSIIQNIFGMEGLEKNHLLFDVLLHLGTLVSVCVLYRKDIRSIIAAFIGLVSGRRKTRDANADGGPEANMPARLLLLIVIATVPLIVIALVKDYIELLFYNTAFIGFAMIITGGLLYISDKLVQGRKTERNTKLKDSLIVGLVQAVAAIPGLSRSGCTITAGIFRGFDREFAVKFSFLLSIPAIIGANILGLIEALKASINWSYVPVYLAGTAVAALSGIVAIKIVKQMIKKNKFGKFAYYCWTIGIITLIASIFI